MASTKKSFLLAILFSVLFLITSSLALSKEVIPDSCNGFDVKDCVQNTEQACKSAGCNWYSSLATACFADRTACSNIRNQIACERSYFCDNYIGQGSACYQCEWKGSVCRKAPSPCKTTSAIEKSEPLSEASACNPYSTNELANRPTGDPGCMYFTSNGCTLGNKEACCNSAYYTSQNKKYNCYYSNTPPLGCKTETTPCSDTTQPPPPQPTCPVNWCKTNAQQYGNADSFSGCSEYTSSGAIVSMAIECKKDASTGCYIPTSTLCQGENICRLSLGKPGCYPEFACLEERRLGDIKEDGTGAIDIFDVQAGINIALGAASSSNADVNKDGSVDIFDIQGIINIPLSGAECIEGAKRPCGQTSQGECACGTQTCISGIWGSCSGEVISLAAETCNELDDDCDGTLPDNEKDKDSDGYTECDGDCDDDPDDDPAICNEIVCCSENNQLSWKPKAACQETGQVLADVKCTEANAKTGNDVCSSLTFAECSFCRNPNPAKPKQCGVDSACSGTVWNGGSLTTCANTQCVIYGEYHDSKDSSVFGKSSVIHTDLKFFPGGISHIYGNNWDSFSTFFPEYQKTTSSNAECYYRITEEAIVASNDPERGIFEANKWMLTYENKDYAQYQKIKEEIDCTPESEAEPVNGEGTLIRTRYGEHDFEKLISHQPAKDIIANPNKWQWHTNCVQEDKCFDGVDNDGEESLVNFLKNYLGTKSVGSLDVPLADVDDPNCYELGYCTDNDGDKFCENSIQFPDCDDNPNDDEQQYTIIYDSLRKVSDLKCEDIQYLTPTAGTPITYRDSYGNVYITSVGNCYRDKQRLQVRYGELSPLGADDVHPFAYNGMSSDTITGLGDIGAYCGYEIDINCNKAGKQGYDFSLFYKGDTPFDKNSQTGKETLAQNEETADYFCYRESAYEIYERNLAPVIKYEVVPFVLMMVITGPFAATDELIMGSFRILGLVYTPVAAYQTTTAVQKFIENPSEITFAEIVKPGTQLAGIMLGEAALSGKIPSWMKEDVGIQTWLEQYWYDQQQVGIVPKPVSRLLERLKRFNPLTSVETKPLPKVKLLRLIDEGPGKFGGSTARVFEAVMETPEGPKRVAVKAFIEVKFKTPQERYNDILSEMENMKIYARLGLREFYGQVELTGLESFNLPADRAASTRRGWALAMELVEDGIEPFAGNLNERQLELFNNKELLRMIRRDGIRKYKILWDAGYEQPDFQFMVSRKVNSDGTVVGKAEMTDPNIWAKGKRYKTFREVIEKIDNDLKHLNPSLIEEIAAEEPLGGITLD